MPKTQAKKKYRLLTIQVAVDGESTTEEISEEFHKRLTLDGEDNPVSIISEWQFTSPTKFIAVEAETARPGDIFKQIRDDLSPPHPEIKPKTNETPNPTPTPTSTGT